MPAAHSAADWPQWRGANRDAKTADFKAPQAWPDTLSQEWKVAVGQGDASPALVGDRLYLFTRQEGGETTLCLNALTGATLWEDKYDAIAANEPRGQHPGPRSSPTVAEGKVLTYGVRGVLSCLDASTGKVLWRKNSAEDMANTWPRFFTSSSPLAADGLCVAQLGSEQEGGIVAFNLTDGTRKWKWTADGTAYASPTLMTVDGTKAVVALTANKIVGLKLSDGTLLWEADFAPARRAYNAATPIVNGPIVIYAGGGRGTFAVEIEKANAGYAATQLWSNPNDAVQFNTPVLKDGLIYGLSLEGVLFCLRAESGDTLWTAPVAESGGFGSVVDAGPVLMALSPSAELVVFEPSNKEFKQLGKYKVADNATYAYPIPTRNGIYIKDQESLILYTAN